MKITVIIPAYNRAKTLEMAVRSVIAQGDTFDLDVLIVDDGSTDGTPDVIARCVAANRQVRTVHRENGGVSQARNTGLAHLRHDTEIVTFLDSDDTMARGRFSGDLPILIDQPDIDVTYGEMVVTTAIDPETLIPTMHAQTHQARGIHLSSMLMRRALVDRTGAFDTSLRQAEDTDYILRIFESGAKFRQTKTVSHYYLRHSGGMTRDIATARRCFAVAILKSIQRRKADPRLQLDKPDFDIKLPAELA